MYGMGNQKIEYCMNIRRMILFFKKPFSGVNWKIVLLKTACWLQYISCYFYWILLWIRTRNAAFFFIVGWHVLKYTVTYAS